jgi:predicted AAA+ superfamily ATPase
MEILKIWLNKKNKKPLVIRGARQVGKTWLMKEFGCKYFTKVAYINCDNNIRIKNVFNTDYDIERLIVGFQLETNMKIEPENTLIILDEIQEVQAALPSLKAFYEKAPNYSIIAAGSLLGMALHHNTSFPVGSVEFLDIFPLSYTEFLDATDNQPLVQLLDAKNYNMITDFKTKYIELLKTYYYIGGMPEVVFDFIQTSDFNSARIIQKNLLLSYEQDFSKHVPAHTVPRLRMIWNTIPLQLDKENKKFAYSYIQKGARAKDFELALEWLIDYGLIYKINRVSKPGIPLKAYQDSSAFKIFFLDIGLLSAMSELDAKSILEGNRIFEEFKGTLTEQYICQQLAAQKITPFFWSATNSRGEIDFVFQSENKIVPLEVKATENLQSKSLKSFHEKYMSQNNIRLSMSDYREEDWLINLPLYAASNIATTYPPST